MHPWAKVNLEAQIPKKEQRQMEAWQRIGTYAAGLALDSAGLKGNKEILSRMDMIVAAGGGERLPTVRERLSRSYADRPIASVKADKARPDKPKPKPGHARV